MSPNRPRRFPICGTVPCRECRKCASNSQAPQPKSVKPAERQKLSPPPSTGPNRPRSPE